MTRFVFCFFCVFLFVFSDTASALKPPWALGQSRGEDLEVILLTFDHGDEIPTWFGHTALLVRDSRLKTERVYNYGMFSFAPDMLPKFMMGRLEFWVAQAGYQGTVAIYKRENRGIRAQVLNLSPEKTLEMAKFLAWNVLPENRNYLYDHYFDNCATRIRDAIDQAVGGQFKQATSKPARMTLRDHTRRHAQRNPYIDFVLTFWMNAEIDAPILEWDEMFLPSELELYLDRTSYVDESGETIPIVREKRIIFAGDREPVPAEPSFIHPWMILFGLFLGGLGVGIARWTDANTRLSRIAWGGFMVWIGLLVGIPGLILGIYPFTEHTITHWNTNAFFASPLTFLVLPLGFAVILGSEKAYRGLYHLWRVLFVLTGIGVFVGLFVDQSVSVPAALFVPLNTLCAFAAFRSQRRLQGGLVIGQTRSPGLDP